jgi:ACS family glucarate transporter-like MFS transporter
MNMGANLGGALSPTITPWIAHQWGWPASLGFAAIIALIGGIMWVGITPGDGLTENGPEP